MKRSYLFLATGFEEIEALATVDVLRRANIDVCVVAVGDTTIVRGAHNIAVDADTTIADANLADADWLILPGGLPGADNLLASDTLAEALKAHHSKGGRIAAICASPGVVLAPLEIVKNKQATAYPGFEDKLIEGGATPTGQRVTVDGNVVTANGPASAVPFALKIAELTVGPESAEKVANGMLC